MIRTAVLGLSEGNGHPFSFAAIVNGYSPDEFAATGWPQILAYLETRDATEFGGLGARVTHAWTQDRAVTESLCRACHVDHAVADPRDLPGEVDAVLLARDDPESHLRLALPFLERGIPVFVDKPLATTTADLALFLDHLRSGLLMSCSALRFARELDAVRLTLRGADDLLSIRGTTPKDWLRYGIHLLDASLPLLGKDRPVAVTAFDTRHTSLAVETVGGRLLQLDCLGDSPAPIRLDVIRRTKVHSHELRDNFTAFRRCLGHFFTMVRDRRPTVPPADTLSSISTLIAGGEALRQQGVRLPIPCYPNVRLDFAPRER